MAKCTAPVRGHSSAAAAARCPACRYKSHSYSGSARHTLRMVVDVVATLVVVVVAARVAVQGLAGRDQDHLCLTHLLKYSHSHLLEKPLKLVQRPNLLPLLKRNKKTIFA